MTKSTPNSPLVITCDGLADALATSVRSIHRHNALGKLPKPSRLGGQLRWERAEIEAWIEAGMPDRRTWERVRSKVMSR
jgi:predicted DNA-binding transcriptional regulator AlpA